MARRIPHDALTAIEKILERQPNGASAQEIQAALGARLPLRTLQYRLKYLATRNCLIKHGEGRWAKYHLPGLTSGGNAVAEPGEQAVPLSKHGAMIQRAVRQAVAVRKPKGYDRKFLDAYRPNVTSYLSATERAHLEQLGRYPAAGQPAGTYAKRILNRLLIDLAWNSSRLEGNTYSRLETKRLIEFGEAAQGHEPRETQMILNHKEAIEFLVSLPEEIGFNRHTILNLHAMLANNLMPDPTAPGRLRHIAVGIERSVFHPLEVPQLIEECFDQVLATAAAINDPFEQAFFILVQLPYLQPFDDVNERVSRLSANIPLIKGNLVPLSFLDVPRQTYLDAMLGVYELTQIDLLKDVFIWAYARSAAHYAAGQQSLGEPDPFRLRHRAHLREVVGTVIRRAMTRKDAAAHIAAWATQKIDPVERERFIEVAETELLSLHAGNYARYQVRPSEFEAWRQVWG